MEKENRTIISTDEPEEMTEFEAIIFPVKYKQEMIEIYNRGMEKGKRYLSKRDLWTAFVVVVAVWLISVILTWNIATNTASTVIVQPVDILIERYEQETGKKLYEWRRYKIKEECEKAKPSEWESIVRKYGDEVLAKGTSAGGKPN